MVLVAQLVRAPDCGSGGRRFKSDQGPQKNPSPLAGNFLGSFGLCLFSRGDPLKIPGRGSVLVAAVTPRYGRGATLGAVAEVGQLSLPSSWLHYRGSLCLGGLAPPCPPEITELQVGFSRESNYLQQALSFANNHRFALHDHRLAFAVPSDVETAAVKVDDGLVAVDALVEDGGDGDGASAGAAGLGDAATALPGALTEVRMPASSSARRWTISMLERLGKSGWRSNFGPISARGKRSASSTKCTAWGLPMPTARAG